MANITVSATLSAQEAPLNYGRIREPVIIGKYDINASKHVEDNKQQKPAETTVPMLAFVDNVLATHYGYASLGFRQLTNGISATTKVIFAAPISLPGVEPFIYAYVEDLTVPANTGHWRASQLTVGSAEITWAAQEIGIDPYPTDALITTAIINGRIFIHIEGIQTYEITDTTFTEVTLGGLTVGYIRGIAASSGYLVAYTNEKPFWSSLSDPLDFVPSDITGAGSSNVQELAGDITLVKAAETGFIMYTSGNAVYALASADIRFPFIFKEVKGLGGVAGIDDISFGASLSHLVRSGVGLKKVSKNGVTSSMNAISDFINGVTLDSIDASFAIASTPVGELIIKLAQTKKDDIVVSYGAASDGAFSGAMYYLTSLNRYSKLSISHKFVLDNPFAYITGFTRNYELGNSIYTNYDDTHTNVDLAETNIRAAISTDTLFVSTAGAVSAAVLSDAYEESESVLILGPFQLVREQVSTLTRVVLNPSNPSKVIVTIRTLMSDGTVRITVPEGRQIHASAQFDTRVTGLSHLVCITGSFDLSSVTLTFAPHSSRR